MERSTHPLPASPFFKLLAICSRLTLLTAVPALTQTTPATPPQIPSSSAQASHSKAAVVKELPMPMTAPLFLESETYTSTLYLVNQLNFGVQADISVYDLSGALLLTGHRYLDANSDQAISIKKLLGDAGFFAQVGSVEVVSPENSAALLGQLSVTRTDAIFLSSIR